MRSLEVWAAELSRLHAPLSDYEPNDHSTDGTQDKDWCKDFGDDGIWQAQQNTEDEPLSPGGQGQTRCANNETDCEAV